jgi:hypothetical protein
MTTPEHERAPPDVPASPEERRSEALEAELAALEAILPGRAPAVAPKPVPEPGRVEAPPAADD